MSDHVIVNSRENRHYSKAEDHPLRKLIDAASVGNEIWYEYTDGARNGSIAKVVDPSIFVPSKSYNYGENIFLPKSIEIETAPGKIMKIGIKSYHNNMKFLIGYTGGHVSKFQKGQPKAVIKETRQPDMLGNNITVGDWVIYSPKGRYGKPGLGKLNRLSAAGNAWVMVTNRHGDEIETQTDGAGTLIKVTMTPELHTTYVLCESLQNLRTKLIIDLDID
jgi:hypothetical protein